MSAAPTAVRESPGAPGSDPSTVTPAVLHLVLGGATILLWAETVGPFRTVRLHPGRDGRAGRGGAILPRQLDPALLTARLTTHPPVPVAPGPVHDVASLCQGSSSIGTGTGGGSSALDPAATGRAWFGLSDRSRTVGGLEVAVRDALAWLHPFDPSAAGFSLGGGWPVLWRAAAVVRAAVARGAVAPHVGRAGGGASVGWMLVPGRAERQALRAAARALPARCVPFGADVDTVVDAFARWYAGALVRAAVSRTPTLASLRRAAARGRTPGAVWLASMLAPAPKRFGRRAEGDPALLRWAADPARVQAPPRLMLRLDEPRPDAPDAWPLAILLELSAEPGVLLGPSAVLSESFGRGHGLATGAPGTAVRDQVCDALRRASACVPALTGVEDGARDEVALTAAEAWRLLSDARPRLAEAGVDVLVPSWWKAAPRPRAQLTLSTSAGGGMFSAAHLVRFDWRVAIGEESLSPQEFERLVARRTPLVRLRGGWAVVPPGSAGALSGVWGPSGERGEVPAGAALLMALRAEAAGGDAADAAVDVRADAEVLRQLGRLAQQADELAEPPAFTGSLRRYQRRGLAWLATRAELGLGGILADDMGLGKTVQVLALLSHLRTAAARGPSLIVAPTSVVANWAAEAGRFTPGFEVVVHQGPGRARGEEFTRVAASAHVVLTSYPLLLRDGDALERVDWDGVILDEAQNIKNAHAKQAQAARRLQARHRFALTGTPVENRLSDLWSIFAFVQPGYLGSAETFHERLAQPIERGGDDEARTTLRRLISPLVLRRTKDEPGVADDLPPRIETLEHCTLTREQAALYEGVARELLERVQESTGMQRKAAVLLALLRLKQVCNHPAHYARDGRPLANGSGKLDRLEALLDEVLAEGDRALVFTQFAAWGRRLAPYLADRYGEGVPVLLLDGSTPAPERAELVARFQSGVGPAVFVLSLKAGGAGLNLTAARHVFHYDRWWNPAVERQATDRAHRIGQTHRVHVHKLMSAGTLEERIDGLIRDKEALAEGVLGAGETWLTELDDKALRDVLLLRAAALG